MSSSRERGFSLVEILASLAILGGTLLVSFDLIDHARWVSAAAADAALNPVTFAAEFAIRRDLQAVEEMPAAGSVSEGPLVVQLHDRRVVTWRRSGDAVIRVERGPDDPREVISQPLARGVTGWSWRVIDPALIEVRFQVAVAPPPSGLENGLQKRGRTRATRVIRVSPRGVLGAGTW